MSQDNGKLRVGILFGGRSGEHEVSLMSARSVLAALDPQKYDVTQIGITHEGVWLVGEDILDAMTQGREKTLHAATLLPDPTRPGIFLLDRSRAGHKGQPEETLKHFASLDVIFPILHGTFGEDGTIQGLMETAELAYVGAGVLGSSLGMDKAVFKDVMRAHGIPVLESIVVLRREIASSMENLLEQVERLAPYPLFVKPVNLGSSVGVSKCRNRSDLYEGLLDAARYDRRVMVERGVNAREIEVSILGNDQPQASVPGEIIPWGDFYSYEAKYLDERSQLLIPAPISAEIAGQVKDIALQAYKAIDCAGMARVDFLLDKDTGNLYLSEVNTIPGFTRISMYPKLWDASGLPYPALVDRLIELALERKAERDKTERKYDVPQRRD